MERGSGGWVGERYGGSRSYRHGREGGKEVGRRAQDAGMEVAEGEGELAWVEGGARDVGRRRAGELLKQFNEPNSPYFLFMLSTRAGEPCRLTP